MRAWRSALVLLAGACALGGVGAAIAQSGDAGRIGPDLALTGNGHQLGPLGRQVGIGNFPTGGAVTRDGHFYWTVSAGRGPNDIRIVDVRSGAVTQVLRLPGASGGIVADPARSLMYVSGVADSPDAMQKSPAGAPGVKGDVIHVFRYDDGGHASVDHLIAVPPPASASAPQNFPPTNTAKVSWPDRLAISPDGKTLLVPLNLADVAAIVDAGSGAVRYVATGNYPYGAAILRDGKTGLVSNETPGTVSVIDLAGARKLADIQVGSHLSHPEAIAVDPKADRAYVAVTNADEVAVIDTKSFQVERTLSAGRPEGLGASPVALTVTPDGSQLLVAEAGVDAIAAYRLTAASSGQSAPALPAPAFTLIGRIPTASYPTDVQVVPGGVDPCSAAAQTAPAASKRRPQTHRHKRKHATPPSQAPSRDRHRSLDRHGSLGGPRRHLREVALRLQQGSRHRRQPARSAAELAQRHRRADQRLPVPADLHDRHRGHRRPARRGSDRGARPRRGEPGAPVQP
jgi:DNA-binding beta-propeller fold protein YncE